MGTAIPTVKAVWAFDARKGCEAQSRFSQPGDVRSQDPIAMCAATSLGGRWSRLSFGGGMLEAFRPMELLYSSAVQRSA